MRAFEIFLNGKKICLAGIGDDGVLTTTITYVPFRRRRETRLYIGGLVLPQHEHVFWKEAILHVGDEVRIKIVEKHSVNRPRTRTPRDPAAESLAEQQHLQKLAKKYGFKLQRTGKWKTAQHTS